MSSQRRSLDPKSPTAWQRRLPILLILLVAYGCGQQPPAIPRESVYPSAHAVRYTVRQGDTLVSIANLYGVAASSIMSANNLRDHRSLYVGQILVIPGAASIPPSVGRMPDLSHIVSESRFIWPVRGRVVRPFDPTGASSEHRRCIIIEARQGEPVVAAMSGVVVFVSESFQGYGKTILIRHANDLSTFYAYNSRLLVREGDTVRQGQPIAEAGQSGRAGAPQLLFRILRSEEPLNPLSYLP